MTKKEREQVVELLRCAADESVSIMAAANIVEERDSAAEVPATLVIAAIVARNSIPYRRAGDYWKQCTEAAARVEEGSWP